MKVLLSDFSQVILFPRDLNYNGSLNGLYKKNKATGFNFLDIYRLNTELLDYLQSIEGIQKHIYTTGTVQEAPEIRNAVMAVFETVFTVPSVGYSKTDQRAYRKIAQTLGVETSEVLFIDDSISNCFAAREAGMQAVQFVDTKSIIQSIEAWLS